MSSIPYSGGTINNSTFTGTNRQLVVTGLQDALINAGWEVISGEDSADVLMKSAVTPTSASNSIRMRLLDPGSGNCAQVTMKNDAGDRTSQIFYLLPAALKTFRVIACRYNFFITTAGTSASREFLCGGTLYIPTFLEGVINGDLGFIWGNAVSDTDTVVQSSPRTVLCQSTSAGASNFRASGLVNGSLSDQTSRAGGIAGNMQFIARLATNTSQIAYGYRWHDDSLHTSEAMLAWGLTSGADESKVRGIVHNCMILSETWAGDDTTISSYDTHAWYAITNNNSGSAAAYAKGTLLAAIT